MPSTKAPPVQNMGGDTLYGSGTGAADNAVTYTSPDVSRFNYHIIEAITVAQDVFVSLDGTNYITNPMYVEDMNTATGDKSTMLAAVPAAEVGILRGIFKKIKVQQAGAGGFWLQGTSRSGIMPRNYRKEYDRYQGTDKQKKRRAARNKARRAAIASGRAKKGDGKDVHHKDGNPKNNSKKNTSVKSKSKNRSFPRTKTARKKKK